MTKQEFESIIAKANLTEEASNGLFEIVSEALLNVEMLKQYDGDAHEE